MKAGFWEILLIVVLVLVLFGHSKIPDLMKNLATGLNVFKKELKSSGDDKPIVKKAESSAKKAVAKKSAKPAVKKSTKK